MLRPRKGRPAIRIRESGNHGARVTVCYRDGRRRAWWVPPGSGVGIGIAAAALGSNVMKLYRLMSAGELQAVRRRGRWTVPLTELRRLKRAGALRDRRRH